MFDLDDLRQQIRARRRALSSAERHHAAQQLAKRVASLRLFTHAHHIAAYLAFDGEMDPAPLVERAWAMGKRVYLPILRRKQALKFALYRPDSHMRENYYGIPEPVVAEEEMIGAHQLDLVLAPLVAFDERGTRMGMGGGFYDRSFAFRAHPGHIPKPRLLGLAYELQKHPELPRREWDVPLDGIATEAALYLGDSGHPLD
ncbi:MAG TPA: 5-formyltetrahydrofolate cyclo-ligase [Candidatus Competibacteraceae bacterium]|nr:5-formyltetrahydrofolate cyclo-ligase [Candidatus Competibacteraceae bacterium]